MCKDSVRTDTTRRHNYNRTLVLQTCSMQMFLITVGCTVCMAEFPPCFLQVSLCFTSFQFLLSNNISLSLIFSMNCEPMLILTDRNNLVIIIGFKQSQKIVEQKLTQSWSRTAAHYSVFYFLPLWWPWDKRQRQRRDKSGLFLVLPTRPLRGISNLTSSTTSIVELLKIAVWRQHFNGCEEKSKCAVRNTLWLVATHKLHLVTLINAFQDTDWTPSFWKMSLSP